MGKVTVLDHPLIKHKLTYIRDKRTGAKEFKELVSEVSMLMAYEVTRDMELEEIEIETPMTKMNSEVLAGKKLGLVPILRAGLGMVEGMLSLLPAAKVGHVGLYRDPETFEPIEYYCKLPQDIDERKLIVLDPMIATGGSVIAAIKALKERGANNIKLVCLIAAPEGLKVIQDAHPDVDIYLANIDEKLNEDAYIVPGLGDAGDRLFGTK
ncbi:MAG TPA: uracil phosphoribosyltransferase [Tissierellaceae bacterium]|nr:uracil phosphoribosyltransferase [Tissierellaceae bacterium]